MEFLFKKFRAAIRVEQIFRRVSSRLDLQTHGAALERSLQVGNSLAVRMIEGFGNSQQRGQPASDPLIE